MCIELKVSIPVGKDSLSMKTKWSDNNGEFQVTSPLSGVVTAMAPVDDVSVCVTPELSNDKDTSMILIKLSDANRLAGSIFSEVTKSKYKKTPDIDNIDNFKSMFVSIQELILKNEILAIHDISDGGLITTLLEMCFTKRIGMKLNLPETVNINEQLFSEESGLVIQVKNTKASSIKNSLKNKGLTVESIASLQEENFSIYQGENNLFNMPVNKLEKIWRETSHAIQSIRDNKEVADSELSLLDDDDYSGLTCNISFDESQISSINTNTTNPRVAILREQGVNGQNEMAAAFSLAGFDAVDVHMQDLLEGKNFLKNFQGMAVCGGFSYGDVLGAGGGWSNTILYNSNVKQQFEDFFNNQNTFTLGVCNGCQMLSHLRELIPGSEPWPFFVRNLSEQFEARFSLVRIEKSPSIFLHNMSDSHMPIVVSHGEGMVKFDNEDMHIDLQTSNMVTMRFLGNDLAEAKSYPANPNGSVSGITGICSRDGRVTLMMPHPERVFRTVLNSWHPLNWGEDSPWMQLFYNARRFVG